MDMNTQNHRYHDGRAARAADLIATLLKQLNPRHRAWATALELQKLFGWRTTELYVALSRVPGTSLQQKAERIGTSKQALSALLHGKYLPSMEIIEKIEAAAADEESNREKQ